MAQQNQVLTLEMNEIPNYFIPCSRCLVVSLDGSGHSSPCAPINNISPLRDNILAVQPITMYQFKIDKKEGTLYYLNDGQFHEADEQLQLFAALTDGLFTFKETEHSVIASYESGSFHRFSILIAVLIDGRWRLRFRVVTTNRNGLLVFKLKSTLVKDNNSFIVPKDQNTVQVFGIKPRGKNVEVKFKVHANGEGIIHSTKPGYFGSITWERYKEEIISISDTLQDHHNKIIFDSRLYITEPEAKASRQDQLVENRIPFFNNFR